MKLTHYDETKKMAHLSQIELKKTSGLAAVGSSKYKHQTPTDQIKFHIRAVNESEAMDNAIKEKTIVINLNWFYIQTCSLHMINMLYPFL